MNRLSRSIVVLGFAIVLAAGCGQAPPPAPTGNSSAAAGPNSRLKFKEEYKNMLTKDGQMRWKPSESNKRPEGIPKP